MNANIDASLFYFHMHVDVALLATPAYHAVPPPGQVERPYPSNQQSPPASVHPLNQRAPPAPKLTPKEKNPTPSSRCVKTTCTSVWLK